MTVSHIQHTATQPPVFETLKVGEPILQVSHAFTRDSLVRYAGASGDFNPIHYRDDVAVSVGLPGVLAHGMLTMAAASSPVHHWLGAAGWVKEYRVRFTRPVPVPAEGSVLVEVLAAVKSIDAANRTAVIDLKVSLAGQSVLGRSQIVAEFV